MQDQCGGVKSLGTGKRGFYLGKDIAVGSLRCCQVGEGFDLPGFAGGDEFGFVVGVDVEEGFEGLLLELGKGETCGVASFLPLLKQLIAI